MKAQWYRLGMLGCGLAVCGVVTCAAGDFEVKPVAYEIGGEAYAGKVVRPAGLEAVDTGIVMVPNWMGVTDAAVEKAKRVAGEHHVVFIADMYGEAIRPGNAQEAGAAAGAVRADRAAMRERVAAAQRQLVQQTGGALQPERIAAIGFCFGGGSVLEYARSGAAIAGVVSFHGDLLSPTLAADAANTRCAVLVLHGADDPFVPPAHVDEWMAAMLPTDVDWQFVHFNNAVHSFTDPHANMPGRAEYHAPTARRAFVMMEQFFAELFE
jgi:dienelactone hydrolase